MCANTRILLLFTVERKLRDQAILCGGININDVKDGNILGHSLANRQSYNISSLLEQIKFAFFILATNSYYTVICKREVFSILRFRS